MFVAYVFVQFGGIGQVAVVRQHDAERRTDVKRLRFRTAARVTRRRVTDVGDARVADQIAHIACAEHLAHHPFALMHMKHAALCRYDARRVLPAVLEHLQSVVKRLVHRFIADQT